MPVNLGSLPWNPDPLIVVPLVVVCYAYASGVHGVWRAAGRGRGIRTWQALTFATGILACAIALVSPLDTLAETYFSAHMAQHLLLMSVAAPLLALGSPELALLWSLSRRMRVRVGQHVHLLRTRLMVLPVAFVLHSVALWAWHAPPLYEAALHSALLHALEHLSLLGTGVLFWSAAFSGLHRNTGRVGAAILYVFAFAAQCTGLGALITLSREPWYPSYTSLDDQVLAGVLMWVPAGMLYLGYALLLLGSWLRPLGDLSRAVPDPLRQPPQQPPGAAGWRRTTPVD
jgi:putative membrane protein